MYEGNNRKANFRISMSSRRPQTKKLHNGNKVVVEGQLFYFPANLLYREYNGFPGSNCEVNSTVVSFYRVKNLKFKGPNGQWLYSFSIEVNINVFCQLTFEGSQNFW